MEQNGFKRFAVSVLSCEFVNRITVRWRKQKLSFACLKNCLIEFTKIVNVFFMLFEDRESQSLSPPYIPDSRQQVRKPGEPDMTNGILSG
uniref:Uncharacterized protein n=1 Tax=Pyxicephalus adspersus TaxID=30357 RepID=A0AAV3AM68_PYXAD|nr:TPA: hypothetical protein GDO54_012610 [Pyxicephalus adspersus]